ncbi:MAG: TolC family protein [Flavobacteriia bacterium]|nr:TolC family protein [Flavobacteriia bacterium]
MKSLFAALAVLSILTSCVPEEVVSREANTEMPEDFITLGEYPDSLNTAHVNWREYFQDPKLVALIDTALVHNQELNITMQGIRIFNNDIRARRGAYMPFVDLDAGASAYKSGRYTLEGATENGVPIESGRSNPDPIPSFDLGLISTWEIDIWNKLHDAKDAAVAEYLASVEGKNFMVTNLISEIASSYYELLALDNQLAILEQNIEIQSNALRIVRLQKQNTYVTELAVRKFEAEVLHTKSLKFDIQQKITETENKINFLLGRYPQPIDREQSEFEPIQTDSIFAGTPSDLLSNRPDIRKAELELMAADLNVNVARKNFYPSLKLSAGFGYQAYQPGLMFTSPESMMYNLAGGLTAPLFNRRDLTAQYYNSNARQIQAVLEYEKTILNAYMEVNNQLAMIQNMKQSLELQDQEVQALTSSIEIANDLFKSARADYMEVLLTQRDALKSRFERVETKKNLMIATVNIYRSLGGGWE